MNIMHDIAIDKPNVSRLSNLLASRESEVAHEASMESESHDEQDVRKAMLDQAFEQAREQGRTMGLADAEAEVARRSGAVELNLRSEYEAAHLSMEKQREKLLRLAESIQAELERFSEQCEATALEVAYAAVLRLLDQKAVERTLMQELCRAALKSHGLDGAVLRVAEDDLESVELDIPGTRIVADQRLRPGQCVMETARGQYETGLDVRLEAMRQAFLKGLAARFEAP